jgi:hypothetical protein
MLGSQYDQPVVIGQLEKQDADDSDTAVGLSGSVLVGFF